MGALMIRYLAIRNVAVIESVAVEFEPSFNVLTGETGAGKSILVEAVGLLLGGRAAQDLIRTGEELATVEAIFDAEDGSELVVRREITAQGRSRAFINGALATAAALKDLANLRIQFRISGLEHSDQRTARQGSAHRLHVGKLRAGSEHLDELRGLAVHLFERRKL